MFNPSPLPHHSYPPTHPPHPLNETIHIWRNIFYPLPLKWNSSDFPEILLTTNREESTQWCTVCSFNLQLHSSEEAALLGKSFATSISYDLKVLLSPKNSPPKQLLEGPNAVIKTIFHVYLQLGSVIYCSFRPFLSLLNKIKLWCKTQWLIRMFEFNKIIDIKTVKGATTSYWERNVNKFTQETFYLLNSVHHSFQGFSLYVQISLISIYKD